MIFTTEDDDLWEADEMFNMRLMVTLGDAVTVMPYNATVTIIANDDAFGVFGFASVSVSKQSAVWKATS